MTLSSACRATHQVLDPLEQLNEDLSGVALRHLLLHNDPVEQLTLRGQLQYEVHTVRLVESALQAEHIRMADTHQHSNLLLQALHLAALARTTALLELLHREPAPGAPLCCKIHRGEVAFA